MKKLLLLFLINIQIVSVLASTQSPDSTLVSFYPTHLDSISLLNHTYLDTNTFHANTFNPLEKPFTLYSTLSNIGMAHKPMRLLPTTTVGFDLSIPAFNNYIRTEKDLKTYLSLLPYSEIRYVMTSGDKEQHLNFRLGRQVYQGLYLSFEYNINYSPGVFNNNKSDNNYFWINALYTTKDQRYRAFAYWFRNKIDVQENGGILYDSVYSQQMESDNAAILTNLNNTTNFIKVSGAGFQHYVNLLPQHKKTQKNTANDSIPANDTLPSLITDTLSSLITDTLSSLITDTLSSLITDHLPSPALDSLNQTNKRRFTLGRIHHKFAYQRNQLFYNETSGSLPFYAPFDTLLNAKTTDTTIIHAYRNSLSWNSLGYQDYSNDVPFYLYAGIDYDFFQLRLYDYLEDKTLNNRNFSQLSLNGGVIMSLFKTTTITGQARLITLGYQIGDFNLHAQWKQRLAHREHDLGKLLFDFDMRRQSPTWFESSYYSNHFRWENDFHAATYLTLNLTYQYKFLTIGAKQTSINDLIYFSQSSRPEQHDGFVSVRELFGSFTHTLRRFQIEAFAGMNMVSDETVMHLPLLLGKLRLSYSQPIFNKAATIQPIISVQYFTKYHADAYMPALRTFYLQDDVLIGNYPFIDVALAINVKQADIYVQYSNLFLITGNHDSFIAPHYPMRDSKIFFGINWRLFN